MLLAERVLHGRQRTVGAPETLDRRHLAAVGLHREHEARAHRLAVEQHRARTAHTVLAAEVRPGESTLLPQVVGERAAGVDHPAAPLAVHRHLNRQHEAPPGRTNRAFDEMARDTGPRRRTRVHVGGGIEIAHGRFRDLARAAPASHASCAARARTGVEPTPNSAMPARPSVIAHATPASAKSPWRRATSSIAKPLRVGHTGKRAATRSSSGPAAVVQVPTKKSSAASRRRAPPGLASSSSAPSATATAGYSDAGSAGERSADRAAIADLEVPDERRGLGEQRHRGRDRRITLHHPLAGAGPHDQRPVLAPEPGELCDPVDVDQMLETRQAQRQHRNQALAPRQHLRLVAVLGEQPANLVDRLRRVVLERRRLHAPRTLPPS